MNQLHVFYGGQFVGVIRLNDASQMQFSYGNEWLESESSFPISLSMPLDEQRIAPTISHNFFANLLPEANVRQRICVMLKISPGNDFELLKAIGGDCAGALTITDSETSPSRVGSYREISAQQLAGWSIGAPDAFSAVTGQEGVRLSLAGAQDKLPVRWDGETFFLPEGDSPSTHLLKFASPYFSHLPENETLTSMLASTLELPVVNIRLQSTDSARIAVVDRYDRVQQGVEWTRLHQEDMCQSLGISPLNKYEKEGGPSLRQCSEIIKQHCTVPALEIDKLLNWSIFNLLAGNSDAHGKNISVLFMDQGSITLAPFYDLVCTRNYENLDRHLAMNIGGESDPGLVGRAHFRQMARDVGVSESLVLDMVGQMRDRFTEELPQVVDDFRRQFGTSPVLERLPICVNQQIRRTGRLMDQPDA